MGSSHAKERDSQRDSQCETVLVCFGAHCVPFSVKGRTAAANAAGGCRTIAELRLAIVASKELSDHIAGRHFALVRESQVWKQRGVACDLHAVLGVDEPEEYPEICSDEMPLRGLSRLQLVVIDSA